MDQAAEAQTTSGPEDLAGQTHGDFQIIRRLGQGGMGQVYLAEQVSLKRNVALKFLKADLAANKFPPAIAAKVKAALNVLIESYNVADTAYLAYHGAALAGTATPADQTALQDKLNTVSNATTALSSAKGGS